MPTRVEKLCAHAEHLFDGLISLIETYAMLHPMLFDQAVAKKYGSNARYRGCSILKNSLFFACCQGLAKLSLDASDRAPSIKRFSDALGDPSLVQELKRDYAQYVAPHVGYLDSKELEALEYMNKAEHEARENEFDLNLQALRSQLVLISSSPTFSAFKTIRDKVSAHTDVHLLDGEYKLVDIASLGVKWKDIRESINELQKAVELIGIVVRGVAFAWDSLEKNLERAARGFWRL